MQNTGKAQVHEGGGHASENQQQILTSRTWINYIGSFHLKWWMQSIIYFENKWKGFGGLNNFLKLKRGALLEKGGGGGLLEDLW